MSSFDYNLYTMHAHGLDRLRLPIRVFQRFHDKDSPVPMHHHDFCEIVLVLNGSATHYISTPDNEKFSYHIETGDVCFVIPGQTHTFKFATDESIKIINIVFSNTVFRKIDIIDNDGINFQEFINRAAKPRLNGSPLHLNNQIIASVSDSISNIVEEATNHNVGYSTLILTSFISILTELYREFQRQFVFLQDQPTREQGQIMQIIEYINKNYRENITSEMLADMAHFSSRHLNRCFKKAMGLTITEYIIAQRISHARVLLATTEMSISAIASETGFNSQSYFCKQFHKLMNCTPNQFRYFELDDNGKA